MRARVRRGLADAIAMSIRSGIDYATGERLTRRQKKCLRSAMRDIGIQRWRRKRDTMWDEGQERPRPHKHGSKHDWAISTDRGYCGDGKWMLVRW